MAVAGASRFIGAATLANTQGRPAAQSSVLGGGSAQSLVDAAKAFRVEGSPGLSASARQGINSFLNATGGSSGSLFGLTTGSALSTADLATQINALRSSLPESQISDTVKASLAAQAELDAEDLEQQIEDQAIASLNIRQGITDAELQEELDEAIRIIKASIADGPASGLSSSAFRRGQLQDESA